MRLRSLKNVRIKYFQKEADFNSVQNEKPSNPSLGFSKKYQFKQDAKHNEQEFVQNSLISISQLNDSQRAELEDYFKDV